MPLLGFFSVLLESQKRLALQENQPLLILYLMLFCIKNFSSTCLNTVMQKYIENASERLCTKMLNNVGCERVHAGICY